MKKILMYISVMIFTVFSLPAFSTDFSFLFNSPVRFYNAEDWKLLQAAAETALNNTPNGVKVNWSNPKTGSSGFLQPLNKITKNGLMCRNLKIFNNASGTQDQYVFMFCKYKSGWKVPSDNI